MKLNVIRKFSRQIVRSVHVAALIAMTIISPVASSLEITLGTAMNLRTDDDSSLELIGVVAAGSVVEIPDKYKKLKKNGQVDAEATFNNWLHEAGFNKSYIQRRVSHPRKDFYFPVRIVSLAKGSTVKKSMIGKTRFMALRVLERSRGGLTVKKSAPVYQGIRDLDPVKPSTSEPAHHSDARPSAPHASAPTVKEKPAARIKMQPIAPAKQETPDAPKRPQEPASAPTTDDPQDSQTEATTSEICKDCQADQPNAASDLATTFTDKIQPEAYNAKARGMQGLGSGFNSRCDSFIEPDGSYGPYGQKVVKNMMNSSEDGRTSDFLADWDMDNAKARAACPNFNSLTDDQRLHFWVYAVAALSMEEASCKPDNVAPLKMNKYGHAVGLLQIEEIAAHRKGRDAIYGGNFCSGANPKGVDLNLRCGVRMIDDVVQLHHGPYEIQTKIDVYENYYSSYRGRGTLAKALISQYKDCGAQPVAAVAANGHHTRHHRSRRRKA